MMLKVGNEFLDFDDLIEMEKQIKLIEDISATDGDFSYSFELARTDKNTYLLGNPQPDNILKPVYQRISAKLLSSDGTELYNGYIRLEKIAATYGCSFFSGNNNWFASITGSLSDMDLSAYDVSQTEANIISSWSETEGLVFPLVDNGPLLTRSNPDLRVEDMVAGFYIKTLFEKVFADAGIKIKGELFNEWLYNNTVCLKNSKSQSEIDARSSFVQKSIPQTISGTPVSEVNEFITWDNDSVYPYYDGEQNNFNLGAGRYTADLKMVVNVDAFFNLDVVAAAGGLQIHLYKNGVYHSTIGSPTNIAAGVSFGGQTRIALDPGDYIEIYINMLILFGTHVDVSGTLKVTPTYIYKTFGRSAAPNWTKQEFVSNILRLFNCLSSYNASSNTLTINLLSKVKDKPSLDLSPYITDTEIDYTEFVSNYGQRSKLSYNEVDFDELKEYNFGKQLKYGQGYLSVNNAFIEEEADIVESDFSNPIAYVHPVFNMSMERLNLIELEEGDDVEFTAVSDNSGVARFAIPDDLFIVGDLVRIKDATLPGYDGDWVVETVGSGWVEVRGLSFDADATGTLARLEYEYPSNDDVFLLVNIPDYPVLKFSERNTLVFEGSDISNIALGYFDVIDTGQHITLEYKQSLSFGGIDDVLRYQMTVTEKYFGVVEQILNDPVKLLCSALIPYHVYRQIDFLFPVTIKTMETTNRYYLNKMTGYKESYYPCTLELIKLP